MAEQTMPGSHAAGACGRTDQPLPISITIRRDAAIAGSRGGAVWAHATKTLTVSGVAPEGADGWFSLRVVPGLAVDSCSNDEHLWVHARDVIEPKPTSGR